MTTNGESKEMNWRKLCLQVAEEPDAQRLSELVEQLILALDDLRQELEGDMKLEVDGEKLDGENTEPARK